MKGHEAGSQSNADQQDPACWKVAQLPANLWAHGRREEE